MLQIATAVALMLSFGAPCVSTGCSAMLGCMQAASQSKSDDKQRAIDLFRSGQYSDAAAMAKTVDASLGEFSVDERWPILAMQSELAAGKYGEALQTLDAAIPRFPNSIRIRWFGMEVCRYNDQAQRVGELKREIIDFLQNDSWRYRDVDNQLIAAKIFLKQGSDAKQVLTKILKPLRDRNLNNAKILQAIGDLSLEKHDYAMAAENFQQAIELDPKNADLHFGLAAAFDPSDDKKSSAAMDAALKINPNHFDSLLMQVDRLVAAENYDAAEKILSQIFKINPEHPIAWSYIAAICHVLNQPKDESEARSNALAHWNGNPEVDHVIGRELSQKYRFEESVTYQRRSLVYDANYLPAKMQLAHDLLRVGQELEGWKLADEVFDADQYSVVAHNLVTLRGNLAKFRTLERDGFVVRMETEESYIYGERVLNLLVDAKDKLCKKYEVELQLPIFIEIFPQQKDFAIRTFGLPGGDGFLGVCFGRLITMNSPAAQGTNLTSWESVLWHEFCHVVTLQKTKNKMPRWLSEGISVYEEGLADSAWHESVNSVYREMMLGDELTAVSKLSGAFLRPPSGLHLQFAYFESSLVVDYIVQEFGLESLVKVLDELSLGTPINDALRRHVAPIDFLDKKFTEFARAKAEKFAEGANWDKPELADDASIEDWLAWNSEHPKNLAGLLGLAKKQNDGSQSAEAIKTLQEVLQIDPNSISARAIAARIYRDSGDAEKEYAELDAWVRLDANSQPALQRLMELTAAENDWEATKKYARKMLALNPLIPSPYRFLSMAAEKTNDNAASIESLQVLARMDPLDAADVHFRLSQALFDAGDQETAKRHVLKALEQAPRYRDAHQLLLKIKEGQ